jgi:hypothetical protein
LKECLLYYFEERGFIEMLTSMEKMGQRKRTEILEKHKYLPE